MMEMDIERLIDAIVDDISCHGEFGESTRAPRSSF